ncbi:hypothetical protein RHGRI_009033 [Rhododendron griersonianum]|uniref:Regulator of Vps4 activity in the MVB pathway protein n=1 Tax=Rhododendron griersonianum TaxID=479676 RepID=A0AAV6L442_9ERIC|nr:hypothetical protein RHGRI_009033 [Rhododendron griersonianum]
MLGGMLGRGFSSKCKSLIKLTRTRIDVLWRRKDATQRYLKSNLAQLLANGLDTDAYGRDKQTEEYISELNLLSCYDFIEQSCVHILKQLSAMQKQSECPEECREAVGSLMFAAARFSDFPELRDLRDTFQERYGSSLEHFVNQDFVKNLASRPPTTEKKIKLLHDIALEFSIKWDFRGFEKRMANPSASCQGQPKKYGPFHDHEDKDKFPKDTETVTKIDKQSHSSKERNEISSDKYRVNKGGEVNLLKREDLDHRHFRREESTGKSQKPSAGGEQSNPKRDNFDIGPRPRLEFTQHNHELRSSNGKEDSAAKGVGKRTEFVNRRYEVHNDSLNSLDNYGQLHTANTTSKVQEEERDGLKRYSSTAPPPPNIKSRDKLVPPPYIKSLDAKHGFDAEASMDPSTHKRENAVRDSERIQKESNHPKYEKDLPYQNDIPIPRPRSMRRKHSEPSSSSHDEVGYSEVGGGVKGSPSSRRRDSSKGLHILLKDEHHRKYEDERVIDNLLLHYSTKTSNYDQETARRKSKKASNGPNNVQDEMGLHPTRCVSLPREQIDPAEPSVKVYTRANSFQPDKPAGHVHPKLPDYDDLAAQLAALRGR